MSRTYSELTNKLQKHPKVHFQQYLSANNEPCERTASASSADLELELFENSESMRQDFRYLAHSKRTRFA